MCMYISTFGPNSYTYPRELEACIIGGEVLRISGWPAQYYGAYFFADFVHGTIL